ncbi:hypothetical protein I6F15_26660 [Bradyrhizobium sp. BRP14]|nr:hypothetical protein [Bradyrhizobium sp. BRP14]
MAGIVVAAIPVLHRVGPRAAVIALAMVNLPATFVVCFLLGTDTGMQMFYLIYGAGAVLIVGVESVGLLVTVTACALALIITLEMFAPKNGGLLSEAAMLGGFIGAVSAAMQRLADRDLRKWRANIGSRSTATSRGSPVASALRQLPS